MQISSRKSECTISGTAPQLAILVDAIQQAIEEGEATYPVLQPEGVAPLVVRRED